MSLLDAIKRDANTITTNLAEFAEQVTFTAPNGSIATVNALHTKHHLGYDLQTAQEINTMKAHICVSEQELVAVAYPVRNSQHDVDLAKHRVAASDANGQSWVYVVEEWFPNDKVGTISIILGRHVQ